MNLNLLNGFDARNDARFSCVERMGVHRTIEDIIIAAKAVAVHGNRWRIRQFIRHILPWDIGCASIQTRQEKDVADGKRKLSDLRFMQCV